MSQEHPNDNLQPTQLTAHEHGASSANNNNNAYSANGQQHDWTEAYNQFKQQVERNVQQQGFLSASLNGGGSTDDAQILRVNQLDAERLDEEIKRYLFFYFSKIFAFFDASLVDKVQPEISAILQFLIYRFSIFVDGQSFGDKLQNLKYQTSNGAEVTNRRKWVHAALTIGLPYAFTRLSRVFSHDWNWSEYPEHNWRRRVWKWVHLLDSYYKVAQVLHFFNFLYNGRYRSIPDRLLGMRLVYARPLMMRHVSFDYMNRELVWNGFAEIVLFLFPLINFDGLRNMILRLFRRKKFAAAQKPPDLTRIPQACPICKMEPIQVPCLSNCKHQFCYYCLQSSVSNDPSFLCPKCGEHISSLKRLECDDFPA